MRLPPAIVAGASAIAIDFALDCFSGGPQKQPLIAVLKTVRRSYQYCQNNRQDDQKMADPPPSVRIIKAVIRWREELFRYRQYCRQHAQDKYGRLHAIEFLLLQNRIQIVVGERFPRLSQNIVAS